jgi:hypothetical protein
VFVNTAPVSRWPRLTGTRKSVAAVDGGSARGSTVGEPFTSPTWRSSSICNAGAGSPAAGVTRIWSVVKSPADGAVNSRMLKAPGASA